MILEGVENDDWEDIAVNVEVGLEMRYHLLAPIPVSEWVSE